MIIHRTAYLDCPASDAYAVLRDLERLGRSLSHARLTDRGRDAVRGDVVVGAGPTAATLAVAAQVLEADEDVHSVVVRITGTDRGGKGAGDVRVHARVSDAGAGSTVDVTADLRLRGTVVHVAGKVVDDVADLLVTSLATTIVQACEEDDSTAVPPTQLEPPAEDHTDSRFPAAILAGGFAAGLLTGYCWARFGRSPRS